MPLKTTRFNEKLKNKEDLEVSDLLNVFEDSSDEINDPFLTRIEEFNTAFTADTGCSLDIRQGALILSKFIDLLTAEQLERKSMFFLHTGHLIDQEGNIRIVPIEKRPSLIESQNQILRVREKTKDEIATFLESFMKNECKVGQQESASL